MEFDYGSILRDDVKSLRTVTGSICESDGHNASKVKVTPWPFPIHTRDLFKEGSCMLTKLYSNEETLERVGKRYSADYRFFGWYSIDHWINRFKICAESHA